MWWADYIVAGILTAYLVGCVWYLAKTMEDKNGKQQH